MPRKLPPLIRLLVSRTPPKKKIYRSAVAHAVFPALGTHLWKTYFRYIDNVEHEATQMKVLTGDWNKQLYAKTALYKERQR